MSVYASGFQSISRHRTHTGRHKRLHEGGTRPIGLEGFLFRVTYSFKTKLTGFWLWLWFCSYSSKILSVVSGTCKLQRTGFHPNKIRATLLDEFLTLLMVLFIHTRVVNRRTSAVRLRHDQCEKKKSIKRKSFHHCCRKEENDHDER